MQNGRRDLQRKARGRGLSRQGEEKGAGQGSGAPGNKEMQNDRGSATAGLEGGVMEDQSLRGKNGRGLRGGEWSQKSMASGDSPPATAAALQVARTITEKLYEYFYVTFHVHIS